VTKDQQRTLFWAVILGITLIFLNAIRGVLLPFVLGALCAYLLDPAADRLEKFGFSRMLSTLTITVGFFFTVVLLCLLAMPVITSEFSAFIVAIPGFVRDFDMEYVPSIKKWLSHLPADYVQQIQDSATNVSGMIATTLGSYVAGMFQSGLAVVNALSLVLITPVVAFYLLKDWDYIIARIHKLLPRRHEATIRQQMHEIDHTLAGFIRGQLIVCAALAAYYVVALSLVGLNFAVILGIMTGILIIIPYVGAFFSMVVVFAIALVQFDNWMQISSVLAVYFIGQALEGWILTPNLVGKRIGLHPVWIIFAMLSGGALFGFIGVCVAVPVAAVIGVVSRFAVKNYLNSGYYIS
jgi:predicted PurR-regulated permease PerM